MWKEEDVRSAAKIFGPLTLFVFTPLVAWLGYHVTKTDIDAGIPLKTVDTIGIVIVVLLFAGAGIWFCRYGLGWFERFTCVQKHKK